MEYRKLGNTGLEVSAISFGGIPLQMCEKEDAVKIIHKAIEMGINFFDNSRIYNGSEDLMGEGFVGHRDKIIIATKSMARDRAGITKDVELSMKAMKTDYIDLYQMHNVPPAELPKVLGPDGAVEGLLKLKAEGKIGHIGITAHSLDTIKKVLDLPEIETIQYPYSVVERQAEEVFREAAKKGKGILAMKPLAGGAIDSAKEALRFIYENKDVTCSIPGMMSVEQVIENLSVLDRGDLSVAELEALTKEASSLGQTFCRRCGYCGPCPQGINIPFSFIVEGYYSRYDLKDWAIDRYNSMAVPAGACTKCGACEPKCPYDLPIRKMLENVKNVFGK